MRFTKITILWRPTYKEAQQEYPRSRSKAGRGKQEIESGPALDGAIGCPLGLSLSSRAFISNLPMSLCPEERRQ